MKKESARKRGSAALLESKRHPTHLALGRLEDNLPSGLLPARCREIADTESEKNSATASLQQMSVGRK